MFVYGHQLGWWRQFFVETLCIFPYDGLYDTLAKMSGFTFKFPQWFQGISKTICILIECANTKWAQKCAKLCSSRSPSIHFMSFWQKKWFGQKWNCFSHYLDNNVYLYKTWWQDMSYKSLSWDDRKLCNLGDSHERSRKIEKKYVLLLVLINQARIVFNASKVNTYSSL